MDIPAFYSDRDFKFQNCFLINPDVIEAFKLRTAIFLDPFIASGDALDQAEHDFVQDLSKYHSMPGVNHLWLYSLPEAHLHSF
jgi:hypothetical protein